MVNECANGNETGTRIEHKENDRAGHFKGGRMQLLVPMKSILTLEGRRCNHGSGIFGTAVSCFLREPDLASRKPVLTQALQDPNSREFLPHRGGRSRSSYGSNP
jgi:hypothetical protein